MVFPLQSSLNRSISLCFPGYVNVNFIIIIIIIIWKRGVFNDNYIHIV